MSISTHAKRSMLRLMGGILAITLLVPCAAFSGTAESLFLEGNGYYEKGNYSEAERIYKTIIEYGIRNEAVYYNCANALFKQDKLGEAILYYEKALERDPKDEEARQNLDLANLLIYDRVERNEPSPPLRVALWVHDLFTLNTQLIIAMILIYIFAWAAASLVLRRRRGLSGDLMIIVLSLSLLLIVILAISAGVKIYHQESIHYGVVLADKVDVLSGPGEVNAVLFPVHEGLKVRIRAEREDWYQISLPNGLNGWVKKQQIGII